jgi:hypothetical protein
VREEEIVRVILLKWTEILLRFVNVGGQLRKKMEVIGHSVPPLRDLFTFVSDLKREQRSSVMCRPFKVGFLKVRKNGYITPSGSHVSSFPERVLLYP